jgi:hypothetical protein
MYSGFIDALELQVIFSVWSQLFFSSCNVSLYNWSTMLCSLSPRDTARWFELFCVCLTHAQDVQGKRHHMPLSCWQWETLHATMYQYKHVDGALARKSMPKNVPQGPLSKACQPGDKEK